MRPEFNEQHKKMCLEVSDELSALTHLNVNIGNIHLELTDYHTFFQRVPEFSYIGLIESKAKKAKFILIFDAALIYKASNILLGGPGIIEERDDSYFTFSEDFIAKEIIEKFLGFYNENEYDAEFVRSEQEIELLHSFYDEQEVCQVVMDCEVKGEKMGKIVICYPQEIYK